jgi:hypothetical protein
LDLKELGFDEPCFGYFYTEDKFFETKIKNSELEEDCSISAPTFSQAFRFFREKYNLYQFVHYHSRPEYTFAVYNDIEMNWTLHEKVSFKTYEEAELECLKKLIEIVKEKK